MFTINSIWTSNVVNRRRHSRSFLLLSLFFFNLAILTSALAHPLGGVVQTTRLSCFDHFILVEYHTHIGPDVVLTLNPDLDRNGIFDSAEREQFLNFISKILLPNLTASIDNHPLGFEEMSRNLTLEDINDFKKGINTDFKLRIRLEAISDISDQILRFQDNNFKAGEMDQLNYSVVILGQIGPISLEDKGRRLVVNLPESPSAKRLPSKFKSSFKNLNKPKSGSSATRILRSFLDNKSMGPGLMALGLLTAFVLGAFHALSPGHGKAMVAAFLAGSKGTFLTVIQLGTIITFTHVFSVIILGIVSLFLSHYFLAQDLIPWLGTASGLLVFIAGYILLAKRALYHHDHHHIHDHDHDHPNMNTAFKFRDIITLGIAGGMVPCPSAMVILLFAIAVNQILFGLLLIISFSLGLASVLIFIGVCVIKTSGFLEKFDTVNSWIQRLPVFSAGIIMVLGIFICLNSLIEAGILRLDL